MKFSFCKHIIPILAWTFILTACSNDKAPAIVEENDDAIRSFAVSRVGMSMAQGISAQDTTILTQSDFEDGSIIYISQMGTTLDPSFEAGSTNMYQYSWYENEEAEWDYEYNFSADPSPLSWSVISSNGQVGNAFSLYGMFFPQGNSIRFNVEKDQTQLENFLVSDVMGAYHATPSLFTRLRFRFFHLMVYLRVTLFVPVLEFADDEYTGYDENALLTAYMVNPVTNFSINWRANRSSDTEAPLVSDPVSKDYGNIYMYQHAGSGTKQQLIDVSPYYTDGDLETDNVRVYEFSVLFPPQTFGTAAPILCFQLQTPGQQNGDTTSPKSVSYYFYSNRLTTETNDFRFTQGTLQQLNLYLPRHSNETVLVSANIIDWTNATTGMTVVEKEETQEE